MDKYTLLLVLNAPFVILGYLKAATMYRSGSLQRAGFLMRIIFWTTIMIGLVFARELYSFVFEHNLSDSTPLSIADVLLVTGIIFCLFLCLRLYSKVDSLEKRFTDLHTQLSINGSTGEKR